jgi:hypothetical protein
MELVNLQVVYQDCGDGGSLVERTSTVLVPKGINGDTTALYSLIFNRLGIVANQLCTVSDSVGNIDPCIGIPLESFDLSTGETCVLYFNDQLTTKRGIGRYVNIPLPNRPEIMRWANTKPIWYTGGVYIYTQYFSAKGVKIANYAPTPEIATSQQELLISLSSLPSASIHFSAPPRLVQGKRVLELSLKTVTYFPSAPARAGRQGGEIIYSR